ncbi:MAG: hypothetical protein ACE148_09255 [Vicinamibacterales bacterium]
MQQRQPRLGDILDDYCPRERRLTNHVVVAMIDDEVKQTRCTTCEADHEYKRARVPAARKKKESIAALARELTADAPQPPAPPAADARPVESPVPDAPPALASRRLEPPVVRDEPRAFPEPLESRPLANEVGPAELARAASDEEPSAAGAGPAEEGPVHRRLIRATLPRAEGQVVRPTPQFTIRQTPAGRGPGFPGKSRGARPSAGAGRNQSAKHGGRHSFGRGVDQFGGRSRGRDAAGSRPRHHSHGRPGKKPSK